MTTAKDNMQTDTEKTLVSASKSALSVLKYVQRELSELNEVLPELRPAWRCLNAIRGEAERLENALHPYREEESQEIHSHAQRAFVESLDKAIDFHRGNSNDPHNIGNAVIAALEEVKKATMNAYLAEAEDLANSQ